MSNEWLFYPLISPWFIGMGVLVLLSRLLWLEWKRPTRYLYARLCATTTMVIALASVLLQPYWRKKGNTDRVAVLTPHYEPYQADSLKKLNANIRFVQIPNATPYRHATMVSLYQLQHEKNILLVLGDGLPPYLIAEQNNSYLFLKSKTPLGIIEWHLPETFNVHRTHVIFGKINCEKTTQLFLYDTGGAKDSISISGKGIHPFQFSITPKQEGKFIYFIRIKDGTTTQDYPFPIEVKTIDPLRILILQSYPSAELQYLKNFLIAQGHHIYARTQLSKNNFRYEYNRIETFNTHWLTHGLLQSFDVVVAPSETLIGLSDSELNALLATVENGLGFIQLIDNSEKKNHPKLSLAMQENQTDTIQLKLNGSIETLAVAPWIVNEPVEEVTTANGRVVSGFVEKGIGKWGFQLLQETYPLILKGKEDAYSSIWSPLLEQVAQRKNLLHKIQIKNTFPIYPNEPIDVEVISATDQVPKLIFDQAVIPLRENVVIDNYRRGKIWADTVGWHTIIIEGDSISKNFYVAPANTWTSLRAMHLRQANELVSAHTTTDTNEVTFYKEQPVSLLVFYILFLLSAAFLWLAPKL